MKMILMCQSYKALLILVIASGAELFINASAQNLNEGSVCTVGDGSRGRCVDINSCPILNKLLMELRSNRAPPGAVDTLRKNICQTDPKLLVCCKFTQQISESPSDSASVTTKKEVTECGKSMLDRRITGGVDAPLFAWPWLAIIKSKLGRGRGVSFTCGGALISEHFVLTAAHCTNSNPSLRDMEILFVRLGEHDLNQDPDCKNNLCAMEHHDALVAQIIVHPRYSKDCRHCHDIALIRLLDPIIPHLSGSFPICLPTNFEHQLNVDPTSLQTSNKYAYIAGWGSIDKNPFSVAKPNILQEAEIPFWKTSYCTEKLRDYPDPNSVFCAGGSDSSSADSCRGDSGGPIMMRGKNNNDENTWYVIGIVSRGPTICGARGTQSIFSNVTYYLPWILENMNV